MRKLVIVAVLGMVLVIVACGPGAEPTPTPTSKPVVVATPTPTAAPLATATATPKRGGILKARTNVTASIFYVHQGAALGEFVSPVYNNLVAQDPLDATSEKIVPDLADRWEISGDGLTYTFFLHKGVKWEDGIPFTAADVKYNFDLVRNPPEGLASPRQDLFEAIASIATPDDYTVVLKLKHVSQSIMAVLGGQYSMIMPKHVMEKDVIHGLDKVMVGTGPYLFKRLSPESILYFERKPDYWKPGLPYLNGIQLIPIADTNAFIAALYTGQIDTAGSTASGRALSKTDVRRIQKERPELIQGFVATMQQHYFALNAKTAPFTNQRVREAVQNAINREEVLNTSGTMGQVGGLAVPGSYWALPAEELAKLPGYGPDISARQAHARQLLKDAGIADGTEITVSAKSTNALKVEMGELIQLQLQKAFPSLKVKIRNYSGPEFDKLEEEGGLHAWYESGSFTSTDPALFGQFITTGGARNYWSMSDPRIDELDAKQLTMLDPAQRRLVVWEVQKLVIQNGAFGTMLWKEDVCSAWPYVKNRVCTASGDISARYEIVWLDK